MREKNEKKKSDVMVVCVPFCAMLAASRMRIENGAEKVQQGILVVLLSLRIFKKQTQKASNPNTGLISGCVNP